MSPTVKIADLPKACACPEHNPPTHYLFEDGMYRHTCPWCGATTTFVVARPTC